MGDPMHTLVFYWEGDGPEADVVCPWEPNDSERPCLMWEDEGMTVPMDGCGVKEYLEAGGYESVSVEGRIESPPVPVAMSWNAGGEYPVIEPASGETSEQ